MKKITAILILTAILFTAIGCTTQEPGGVDPTTNAVTETTTAARIPLSDAVKKGHSVVIDFVVTLNGKEVENGTTKGMELVIGSKTFVAGLEDGIIGMKTGDTKNIDVTFPQDYRDESLAGKKVVYKTTLKAVYARTVQMGDTANIDYEGYLAEDNPDKTPFPGGTGAGYDLTIGSRNFIPGFEEQLVGMEVSETREIRVTFPADYKEQSLAGKPAIFKVTVNEIK